MAKRNKNKNITSYIPFTRNVKYMLQGTKTYITMSSQIVDFSYEGASTRISIVFQRKVMGW